MKNLIITTVLLSSIATMTFSMDKAAAGLQLLGERTKQGDVVHRVALAYYNESLNDPNYKIPCATSIKLLTGLGLLDRNNKAHQEVRAVYFERLAAKK